MLTTMNIALLGGAVLLLALLVVLRMHKRKGAATGDAPAKTAAPPAPKPVFPTAAAPVLAAAEAAATLAPVDEDEAVEWPEVEEPQIQAIDEPEVAVWSTDEVITEPGWPMPGEVGNSWPAQPEAADEVVTESVMDDPIVEAEAPVAEAASWDQPDAAQPFDPASGWVVDGAGAEPAEADAPAAPWRPEPVVETIAWDAPEPVAQAEEEDEVVPFSPEAASEPIVEAVEPFEPVIAFEPVVVAEPVVEEEPVLEVEPVVTVLEAEPVMESEPVAVEEPVDEVEPIVFDEPVAVEEPVLFAPVAMVEPAPYELVAVGEPAHDPAARWAAMAPASRNGSDAHAVARRTPTDVWSRLRPTSMGPSVDHRVAEALPIVQVAGGNGAEHGSRSGSFALGGYAAQPGEEAVTGVAFPYTDQAPRRWRRGPSDNAAPGTLVLNVDETLNCTPDDVAVITDPGFAPTGEGFIVRVAARAAGPFAARGTYQVR